MGTRALSLSLCFCMSCCCLITAPFPMFDIAGVCGNSVFCCGERAQFGAQALCTSRLAAAEADNGLPLRLSPFPTMCSGLRHERSRRLRSVDSSTSLGTRVPLDGWYLYQHTGR